MSNLISVLTNPEVKFPRKYGKSLVPTFEDPGTDAVVCSVTDIAGKEVRSIDLPWKSFTPPANLQDAKGTIKKLLGTPLMKYLTADCVDAASINAVLPVKAHQLKKEREERQFRRLSYVLETIDMLHQNGFIGDMIRVWLVGPNPDLNDGAPLEMLSKIDPAEAYEACRAALDANMARVNG